MCIRDRDDTAPGGLHHGRFARWAQGGLEQPAGSICCLRQHHRMRGEITDIDQRTLVISRTLNAPATLVFEAWTHPRHLVRWWGPNDFTLSHCEQDFRVGG